MGAEKDPSPPNNDGRKKNQRVGRVSLRNVPRGQGDQRLATEEEQLYRSYLEFYPDAIGRQPPSIGNIANSSGNIVFIGFRTSVLQKRQHIFSFACDGRRTLASSRHRPHLTAPPLQAPSAKDILGQLEFFFGKPAQPEKLVDFNDHHAATYHFPDAYLGKNVFLRDTLSNLILKSPQTWHTSVAMPYVQTEGVTVQSSGTSALRHAAHSASHCSSGRLDRPTDPRVRSFAFPGCTLTFACCSACRYAKSPLNSRPPHRTKCCCGPMKSMDYRPSSPSEFGDAIVRAVQWRSVPGFNDELRVSSEGMVQQYDVRGKAWWPPKWATVKRHGYPTITHRQTVRRVHQLVALAFVGPQPTPGHTVDHIAKYDGDWERERSDNRACNLRWATRAEQTSNRTITTLRVDSHKRERSLLRSRFVVLCRASRARRRLAIRPPQARRGAGGWRCVGPRLCDSPDQVVVLQDGRAGDGSSLRRAV